MHFRPLPGLSIATGLLFVALVGLGIWQLERLQWKLALIASAHDRLNAPPIPFAEALREGDAQYRRVVLHGRFQNGKEAFVFATDASGAPAYHVIVPFATRSGVVMVDRGIVPPSLRDPANRKAGSSDREQTLAGVWHLPEGAGIFTPAPDLERRIWYARDIRSIARQEGIHLATPAIIEADASPNPGGWPRGGQTVVTFRNDHLQYALTWFALALGLVCVYIAYHASKGRLARGRSPVAAGEGRR
ncbi:MAG: SURF1 family protein [Alphaproteobacteria bacterium]|nr:SURF1 family protein [Alphaproteobacteria bacterium]